MANEATRPTARLDGRVALITGSGGGMGRAHALLMAKRGAGIVVHDINAKGAEETAAGVRRTGARAEVILSDVADIASMRRDIRAAEQRMGSIDILVNNAGIDDDRPIEGYDEASFQRVFDVHVKGSFFATQAVVPGMKARKRGKIINISSIWGMTAHTSDSVYCGAKAGPPRPHQGLGEGIGPLERPCERDLPRRRRHGHGHGRRRDGSDRAEGGGRALEAFCRARRDLLRRRVPGLGRGRFHHGPGDLAQWRAGHRRHLRLTRQGRRL